MADINVTLKRYNGTDNDFLYPKTQWSQIINKPLTFTPTSHTHTEDDITDLDKYSQATVDYLLANKVDVGALSSNIIVYATTAASDVVGYNRAVTSLDDTDYNDTAVDVTTPSVTGAGIGCGVIITDADLFIGNPGVVNIPIVGNVKANTNNATAEFYFEIYKRDNSGVETLLTTSTVTNEVTALTYEEFSATALLNNGTFVETDRLVFKFFANKTGSVDGTFDFQFGGGSPVRALLNLPIDVTLQAGRMAYDNTTSGLTATDVQAALDELEAEKATPADITAAINGLLDSAPATLDTLNELAAALGDDPNFATTVTNELALKANAADVPAAANDGILTIASGSGLTGSGDFTADQATNETITLSHADTSTQASVSNSGTNFIQSITLDDFGHITAVTSADAAGGAYASGVVETNASVNTDFWVGTQAQYDALTPDATTLYFIKP